MAAKPPKHVSVEKWEHTPLKPIGLPEIKLMLRVTANAVAQGETVYLPLLERLERDYALAQKNDPATYAQRLLETLNQ